MREGKCFRRPAARLPNAPSVGQGFSQFNVQFSSLGRNFPTPEGERTDKRSSVASPSSCLLATSLAERGRARPEGTTLRRAGPEKVHRTDASDSKSTT